MSIEAVSRVLNMDIGDPTRKLILIGFANHSHHDGTVSYASVSKIASYAGCTRRTVQRHVSALLAEGYMREGDQRITSHFPNRQRPVVYDLSLDEETRERWAANSAEHNTRRAGHMAEGATRHSDPEQGGGDSVTPPLAEGGGDTGDTGGGDTGDTPGGDTAVSPKPSLQPSVEPSKEHIGGEGPSSPATTPPVLTSDDTPNEPVLRFKQARQIPDDFAVTPRMRAWFADKGIAAAGVDGRLETEQFIDHHIARGTQNKDWEAAWRTWMRNAAKYAAKYAARAGGSRGTANTRHTDAANRARHQEYLGA